MQVVAHRLLQAPQAMHQQTQHRGQQPAVAAQTAMLAVQLRAVPPHTEELQGRVEAVLRLELQPPACHQIQGSLKIAWATCRL
jgi:hypothetical protein